MATGKELKEQGQAIALEHAGVPWTIRAMSMLTGFCKTGPGAKRPFAMEDFRQWALANGLDEPPSHKAWGALPRLAASEGLIVPTGQYRNATSPKTHAHPVKVWRSAYLKVQS